MEFKVTLDFMGDKTVLTVAGEKSVHDLATAYTRQCILCSTSKDKADYESVYWEATLINNESLTFDLKYLSAFTVADIC